MWYVVEHSTGERQVIETIEDPLDGLGDGWTVIASDVGEPPEEADWDGVQWVVDEDRLCCKRQECDEMMEISDPKRLRDALKEARNRIAELDELLQQTRQQANTEIGQIEARLSALEGK